MRFAILLAGEQDAIRDPNASNSLGLKIADQKIDFYVLDYTTGSTPFSIWSAPTGDTPNHIISATGKTVNQLYNSLYGTLINDVNYIGC